MLYNASSGDSCFDYDSRKEQFTIVAVYVDDILVASKKQQRLREIKTGLSRNFEIKDLGLAQHCLGVEICQKYGEIKLKQSGYIKKLLTRLEMVGSLMYLKIAKIPDISFNVNQLIFKRYTEPWTSFQKGLFGTQRFFEC